MTKKKKVIVAMSGGVDSSIAAYLLLEQGYEVIGATMRLWECEKNEDMKYSFLNSVQDAKKVAKSLNIPHYVFNMKVPFRNKVMDYFVKEYLAGKTPNPCIACNKHIKFGDFLEEAQKLNADYIATGHYAIISHDKRSNKYLIKKAVDNEKDQSYFLYNLTQNQLRNLLMPLGRYTKDEIRKKASELGLNVAHKKDSQEICFVPKNDYKQFIKDKVTTKIVPGSILNSHGEKIGEHRGIAYYTIGQRRGLGIAKGVPLYVVDIDKNNNTLIVGERHELQSKGLIAKEINLISLDKLEEPLNIKAKVRYNTREKEALITPLADDLVQVIFHEPEFAITPGQSVVFYDNDLLIGGGVISRKI